MSYLDNYNKYIEFLTSNEYKKYMDSLRLFFNNSPNQLCPSCNKSTIEKNYEKGTIFMKCTNASCDWKMSIEVAEYVHLDKTLYADKYKSKSILYELLSTDDFSSTKNRYLLSKKEIDDIIEIFKIQQEELNKRIIEKIELYSEISIMYYNRKNVFSQIEKPLDNVLKKSLLEIYKNEYKNITEKRYVSISKQFKISENDLKNTLLWFDISAKYIEKQTKLREIIKNITIYEKHIENINNNMMIKFPIIKEGREVDEKMFSNSRSSKKIKIKAEDKEEDRKDDEKEEDKKDDEKEEDKKEDDNEGENKITGENEEDKIEKEDESKNIKTIMIDKNMLKNIDEEISNIDHIEKEEIDNVDEEEQDIVVKINKIDKKGPKSSGEKRIKLKIAKR